MKPQKKTQTIVTIDCPYCQKPIQLHKVVETIEPAVKAIKKVQWLVFKDTQQKL